MARYGADSRLGTIFSMAVRWAVESVYSEPDATGLVTCKRHPHAPAFRPEVGCSERHDTDDERPEPGDGEKACALAAARGLPDLLDTEARLWGLWRTALDRSMKCAGHADAAFDSDPEQAVKWEAAAAKWADVSIKAGKLAAEPVLVRERNAGLEKRQRNMPGSVTASKERH